MVSINDGLRWKPILFNRTRALPNKTSPRNLFLMLHEDVALLLRQAPNELGHFANSDLQSDARAAGLQ